MLLLLKASKEKKWKETSIVPLQVDCGTSSWVALVPIFSAIICSIQLLSKLVKRTSSSSSTLIANDLPAHKFHAIL